MHKRRVSFIFLTSLIIVLLSGCMTHNDPVSKTDFLFDTIVTITLYGNDKKDLLDECFSLGREYEQKLSKTIPTSEISLINQAKGKPVEVSDETIELLQKGIYYGDLSKGLFDITIAPVSGLWDFKSGEKNIPDAELIKENLSHVNYQNILISGNVVTLLDPNMQIDLGGIAKGFIADKIKEYLVANGEQSGIINLGGNILTLGSKNKDEAYTIGIQYPFKQSGEVIDSISIVDESLVSSGNYERYFELDGQIYHHILDSSTGYPISNDLNSVTVISQKSVDGDGLSTTCFLLGLDNGLKLIESLDNTEAIFITKDNQLHYSSGIKKRGE